MPTKHTNGDIAEIGEEMNHRKSERPLKVSFPRFFVELLVGGVESSERASFVRIGLDDKLAGVVLFYMGVEFAESFALGDKVGLGGLGDFRDGEDGDRNDNDGNGGEQWRDDKHHDRTANNSDETGEDLG